MNADSEHAWNRTFNGWQIVFWVLIGVGFVRAATAVEESATRRWLSAAVIAVLAVSYLVLRPRLPAVRRRYWPTLAYQGIGVVCAGVACGLDPNLSWLLFVLFSQMWMFADRDRDALLFTGALGLSSALGLLNANGWSRAALWVVLPVMGACVVTSSVLGLWISRIVVQSVERADLITQLEATRSELGRAHHAQGVMAERERLAREIHDTLAQGYTSIVMLAQAARAQLETGGPGPAACASITERLDSIEDVARENLGEARALVAAFAPVGLDGSSLADAVRRLVGWFGAETGLAVDVRVQGTSTGLSRDREVVLLRAAQEALANVRRHARASQAGVSLVFAAGDASVEVVDDGVGFDPGEPGGYGLTGMSDRVRESGGELLIDSAPGRGTRVSVRVPVAAPAEAS